MKYEDKLLSFIVKNKIKISEEDADLLSDILNSISERKINNSQNLNERISTIEIELDAFAILNTLWAKYKNEDFLVKGFEIAKKVNSFFNAGPWAAIKTYKQVRYRFGFKSGICVCDSNGILTFISKGQTVRIQTKNLILSEFGQELEIGKDFLKIKGLVVSINSLEKDFFLEFLDCLKEEYTRLKELLFIFFNEILEFEKSKIIDENLFVAAKNDLIQFFDKDGNGTIDVIEGADDFLTLFKKHQKAIIEIDKDYIQKFVKTSNYLKTKRRNIQTIFENFQQADTHEDLENRVGILKNDIHTYEVLLMHSLNMIMTLVNEDMITFYEIYESFDKLNVFNSNWENEVSGKLSDIGDGLNQLIYSVNKMNQDIVQELSYLSYITETSFQELQSSVSAELSSINSSIQFGNLLSGIQTYQLHKINKRGDNLLK